MKKPLSLILVLTLLLTLTAGCTGENPPDTSPSDKGSAAEPTDFIQRGDVEIPLDALTNPTHIAVDNYGMIYIDDINKIYAVGSDNELVILIDGLNQCSGISAVGDKLYVFDVRDDLYLLTYNLQGKKLDERKIILDEDPATTFCGFVFQNVPVAYLGFGNSINAVPYLYHIETGILKQVGNGDYDMINPLANGRIAARAANDFTLITLTVNTDGSVTETKSTQQKVGDHFADITNDKEYSVNSQDIRLINETGYSVVAQNPLSEKLLVDAVCANNFFYFLENMDGIKKITVFSIPVVTERRVLRIYDRGYNKPQDLNDFIKYFQIRHPDVDIQRVPYGSNDDALKILSGEMDIDLIYTDAKYTYSNAGATQDLSIYPDIVKALNNTALLEGIKELSLNPDGSIFGIPCNVYYTWYIVNEPLFQQLGLTVPPVNWTVDDYYNLAKTVSGLNNEIYLEAKNVVQWYTGAGNVFKPVWRLSTALTGYPVYSGFNSSNGYKLRIDTPEMISYIKKATEIFDLFPFVNPELSSGEYDENILLWEINIFDSNDLNNLAFKAPLSNIILPIPRDVYGNRTSEHWDFLTIYTKSKNPRDAALFVAEFLSEDWHRDNARLLQLFSDLSAYKLTRNMEYFETLIAQITKESAIAATDHFQPDMYFDLEDRYFSGELTAEQFAKELQKAMEKRLLG